MLAKEPQRMRLSFKVKALVGFAVVSEVVFLSVSCIYFRKMHEDRDLRKKLYMKMPWFSKLYYDILELRPNDKTNAHTLRQRDYAAWGVTNADK